MNELMSLNEISGQYQSNTSILFILFSFIGCMALSFLLRYVYVKRSFSLTGKAHIGAILPILSGIVFLVIVIVKSSLALSLGLVGALSIVRFRTPIKEPEELVYLFLAITIGLGFGAGYILETILITILLLSIINYKLSNRSKIAIDEYNLVVSWHNKKIGSNKIINIISDISDSLKVVRIDLSDSKNMLVAQVTLDKDLSVDTFIDRVLTLDPKSSVQIYESNTNF
jgi:hypothetical protein